MYDVCFLPENPGRADASRVDPRAAVLCYDVFASLGGAVNVLALLWSLSGETCGEQTCSAALVFVQRKHMAK